MAFHKLQQSIPEEAGGRAPTPSAGSSIRANPRLFSRAHAVESQFGRSVQLFQFKPNTHPSIQTKYPSFSFESLSSLFSKLMKDRCSKAIQFVLNLCVCVHQNSRRINSTSASFTRMPFQNASAANCSESATSYVRRYAPLKGSTAAPSPLGCADAALNDPSKLQMQSRVPHVFQHSKQPSVSACTGKRASMFLSEKAHFFVNVLGSGDADRSVRLFPKNITKCRFYKRFNFSGKNFQSFL